MSYERSFAQAASIIQRSPILMNAFYNILSEIAQTEIVNRLMNENPLAWMTRKSLESGDKVREIYVALCEAQIYDADDQSYPLDADKFDVDEVFHPINYKRFYSKRYSEPELLSTFTSIEGFDKMLMEFPKVMYDSAELDEFLVGKYQMARAFVDGVAAQRTWAEDAPANDQNALIKEVSSLMEFATQTEFNQRGVPNPTPREYKHIVMTSKFKGSRDSTFLASVFNLDKAELDTDHYNVIDSFGFTKNELTRLDNLFRDSKTGKFEDGYTPITAEENDFLKLIPCAIFDERFFQNYRTFVNMRMENELQPKNLNRYLFLHIWKVLSVSPFHNAIVFLEGENGLSVIDLTTLAWEQSQSAYVAGADNAVISDPGYDADVATSRVSVSLPVGAISEGQGLYAKLGNISPAEISVSLTSDTPLVQTYIDNGLLRVAPIAGGLGKIVDTATQTYGSGEAYGDITDRTATYAITIDAAIRQASAGYSARTAKLTIGYKGISKTATVQF